MPQIQSALYATALYMGLQALISIWLAGAIGVARGRLNINIGDGGNPQMIRVMRGQANFVENVPLALLMLLMAALMGIPAWVIHILGLALFAGRILHGLHFTRPEAPMWQRAAGAGLTALVILLLAVGLIIHAIANFI